MVNRYTWVATAVFTHTYGPNRPRSNATPHPRCYTGSYLMDAAVPVVLLPSLQNFRHPRLGSV